MFWLKNVYSQSTIIYQFIRKLPKFMRLNEMIEAKKGVCDAQRQRTPAKNRITT